MIAKSIHRFYWFGTCVRYLQDAPTNLLRAASHGGIVDNIEAFFRYIDELNLVVTKRTTNPLFEFTQTLSNLPPETILSEEQSDTLRGIIIKIRSTLEAEIRGFEAYVVTPKRYDVHRLLNDMGSLLALGVYQKLPLIAQFDLREAGTCIAFERSTAAAFHILRGTESVLREFYRQLIKQKRVELLWGPIITDIRKRRVGSNYSVLLDNLDNIRRSFRNPTQHPELTYTIDEVQDLLGLCIDVINRMGAILSVKAG
jgi:hypothetical protein